MGPAMRAVQTGIGLVAELKAARKERNATQTFGAGTSDVNTSNSTGNDDKDEDEEDEDGDNSSEDDKHFGGSVAMKDSGADATSPPAYDDEPPAYSAKELANISADDVKYPQPVDSSEHPRLRCPVVIPQRRPGSKNRGFLRAYAPILADRDIDEQTFLKFLKDFHRASQASPILNVITIGAGAISLVAAPFTIAAAITIAVASGTAAELQSRYRTNTFLDQVNASLFKPRGLYCLVMSLRPNDMPKGNIGVESVDTSTSAALKWQDNPNKATTTTFRAKLRGSSGVTHGEAEMPETAPLIYPDTGYAELGKSMKKEGVAAGGKQMKTTTGEFAGYQKVVGNYFDKRAQAKYAYKHPESSLAAQDKPQFASKYGDPTHPSVTTTYWGRAVSKIEKESLAERQARRHARALETKRQGGGVRRLLEGSVLYLMIVDLPSDAEVEAARGALEEIPVAHSLGEVM